MHRCVISVPPAIPASVLFHVDYQTGLVTVTLANVDRLDRVTLEFQSNAIEELILGDLVSLARSESVSIGIRRAHREPIFQHGH